MKLKYYLLTALMLSATLSATDEEDKLPVNEFYCTEDSDENEELEVLVQAISDDAPYRLLCNKDPQGWNVELDDGAIWRAVNASGARVITLWRTNDPLVIHPTLYPSLSGGRFYILNERLGTSAVVELSAGPILNRATNSQLTYIDYSTGVVQIQDGSGRSCYFRLDYSDRSTYQKWIPGQSIILGSNADCYYGWFSSYKFILINVESNTFACANLD